MLNLMEKKSKWGQRGHPDQLRAAYHIRTARVAGLTDTTQRIYNTIY